MSDLSLSDKKILEAAFNMSGGHVLDFSDRTFSEFFAELGINISEDKYYQNGTSKANRLRTFWNISNNEIVGKSIIEMAKTMMVDVINNQSGVKGVWLTPQARNIYNAKETASKHVEQIGKKLLENKSTTNVLQITTATITDNKVSIEIRPEIYQHIKRYLDVNDYFHAVEEAYKVVRDRLKTIGYGVIGQALGQWLSMYTKCRIAISAPPLKALTMIYNSVMFSLLAFTFQQRKMVLRT